METDFTELHHPLAAQIKHNGQSYLYFGGTAYLGIPQHKEFIKNCVKGIEKFGLNNGTSRGNNIQLGIYNDAENCAASRFGAEAALITSSGYLAAQLTVKAIAAKGEVKFAPATHPALWLNEDPQTTGTFTEWAKSIVEEINNSEKTNWVLISNSMNNLFPEIYDFSFIQQINKGKQVILVVDDSHGIGINNAGLSALSAIPAQENASVILIASMAKALGVDAGLVLGTKKLIDELKQSHVFLGASPPAAAALFAFMEGEKIYQNEWNKLQENRQLTAKALAGKNDWYFIDGFPVFLAKNADISEKLFEQNILISSFPYPDQHGPIINRIVLSSWHSKAEINQLINAI